MKKTCVRAANGDSPGSATYLRARVDGREQDCLLDTGSEVSLLPASLVPKSQIRPTDYTLRAANGTRIEVLGCAEVPITTELFSSTIDGIATNHVTEVMLGADWLSDNNAQWNFVDSTVNLNGSVHKLNVRPRGEKWCRRVVIQEKVVVQPWTQQDVKCLVVFHGLTPALRDEQWETEPSALSTGLLVARSYTVESVQ